MRETDPVTQSVVEWNGRRKKIGRERKYWQGQERNRVTILNGRDTELGHPDLEMSDWPTRLVNLINSDLTNYVSLSNRGTELGNLLLLSTVLYSYSFVWRRTSEEIVSFDTCMGHLKEVVVGPCQGRFQETFMTTRDRDPQPPVKSWLLPRWPPESLVTVGFRASGPLCFRVCDSSKLVHSKGEWSFAFLFCL